MFMGTEKTSYRMGCVRSCRLFVTLAKLERSRLGRKDDIARNISAGKSWKEVDSVEVTVPVQVMFAGSFRE